ncbi:MAG TPA: carboxypeptidase-like regulatory domain-containing protein [Flavobacterium sp.]|nr:carboxypeptidase-like regulatory domain-containing protein [Flavobacterium sp.]
MRIYTVFIFLLLTSTLFAQQSVKGTVLSDQTYAPEANVSVINLNSLKVAQTDQNGVFEIQAALNDTLHISADGYKALKIKVTNDWLKGYEIKVYIKDLSTMLDELIISNVELTGFLEIDSKRLAYATYDITGSLAAAGLPVYHQTALNPVKKIYDFLKKNSKTTQTINRIQQENELIELMKTKYDRETVSALLNISKEDIVAALQMCNKSERFIYTASDYQIFIALNECARN